MPLSLRKIFAIIDQAVLIDQYHMKTRLVQKQAVEKDFSFKLGQETLIAQLLLLDEND